jgi:outer membrane putative beta-barrel porin/alpha-amylase
VTRSLALVLLAGVGLLCARAALSQDLTPRAYFIAPVGTNALDLSYAYMQGNLDFAGALPITGATASVSLPAASYYHSFDFFGRTANFLMAVPYGLGDYYGTVAEVPRSAYRSGSLDAIARLAVNLIGGPAMAPAEFAGWRQTTLLGASLKIVAPTGQYDPTRLINWGANRWAFKPELGYSQRFGNWVVDGYGAVWFFTKNDQFYPGMQSQTQAPVGAVELHLSRDFGRRLWISLDANYWWGGATSLNGVENNLTTQKSSRIGITGSVPITAHQSLKLSVSDGAYVRYGGNYRTIALAWQYAWFGWRFR